jgi:hypothetical protein
MKIMNGLRMLLATAILCGMVQPAASQSSAKAEVFAALAEQDKAFFAGDETKMWRSKSEDYLQTNVRGIVQDKQAWFKEYFEPLAPLLRAGKTRLATFERSDIVFREFGDTVVIVGKLTYKFAGVDWRNPKTTIAPGPPRVISFTQVWVKRGGLWKEAVLHNATPQEHLSPASTDRK